MSRRIEITVPNEWAEPVRECLADEARCNLTPKTVGDKPHMIVEMPGTVNTVFLVTVPGPAVTSILSHLRKSGIGTSVGRLILSPLDYVKPDLSRPLTYLTNEEKKAAKKKGLVGFQHFQKARRTTEELYNEISTNANMSINTWLNLIGACVISAGGLATNTVVFLVAAMLVSPIMGPILGMTFGYRIADWPLFKTGFINEVKMAITAFLVGVTWGFVLGDVGKTYKWPNSAMMPEGQAFNLIISIVVSSAAGTVLGVSLTASGGNALVGTAISAGLLPPIVNAGMMISYAIAYAPASTRAMFFATANFVFWLKDIDPRFREGDDTNFNDIPSLVAHKKRIEEKGLDADKLNIAADVKDYAIDFKEKAQGIASLVTGGIIPGARKTKERNRDDGLDEEINHEDMLDTVVNPIQTTSKHGYSGLRTSDQDIESGIELQDQKPVEERVRDFYAKYNPTKLDQVPEILAKYQGKEEELLRKLRKQYGVKDSI